jgi:hypothetical protein
LLWPRPISNRNCLPVMLPTQTKRLFLHTWANATKIDVAENTLRAYRRCMQAGSPRVSSLQVKNGLDTESALAQDSQTTIPVDGYQYENRRSCDLSQKSIDSPQLNGWKQWPEQERLKTGGPMTSLSWSSDSDCPTPELSTLALLKVAPQK